MSDAPILSSTSGKIVRLLAGEQELFSWLAEFVGPWLIAYAEAEHRKANGSLRSDAAVEDWVQSVWVRAMPYLSGDRAFQIRKDQPGYRRALLMLFRTLLLNAIRDSARRIGRQPRRTMLESSALAQSMPTPGGATIRREQLSELGSALKSLSAADRELLLARYMDGRKVREIAASSGVSYEAATKRIYRARMALRERFPQLDPGE